MKTFIADLTDEELIDRINQTVYRPQHMKRWIEEYQDRVRRKLTDPKTFNMIVSDTSPYILKRTFGDKYEVNVYVQPTRLIAKLEVMEANFVPANTFTKKKQYGPVVSRMELATLDETRRVRHSIEDMLAPIEKKFIELVSKARGGDNLSDWEF